MMTVVRLPSWWIHHLCIVELWVIWIVGDIRKMGTGRIIENGGLCEVVGVDFRVVLHTHDQMTCALAIVWIMPTKIFWESPKTKSRGFQAV